MSAQPKDFMVGRGQRDGVMACPHCYARGYVYTQPKKVKGRTAGGKATGAPRTGGISMLATKLSRKSKVTEAFCANCEMVWHV